MIRKVVGKARAGFDHHLSHQRARPEDGGGAADDRAAGCASAGSASCTLSELMASARRRADAGGAASRRRRSPPGPDGPPPIAPIPAATCRRRRRPRGRSDPRAVASQDRPRVARRRAQAGGLDRRHRAVEGPRLPRGRRSAATWPGWRAPATSGSPRAAGGRRPGIVVATDGFLLGGFIALLAVRPEASGQGLGPALVAHVEARVFARRRWLFVSCDAGNRAALRFYRRQGFARVGRLPDLVRAGRVELLLPQGRSRRASADSPSERALAHG